MPTIAATSDFHGHLPPVPECDVLLIAGDLCNPSDIGRQLQWLEETFAPWLESIPAKEVVGIAGNHDFIYERSPALVPKLHWHYLQDSGVELFGLKFFGSPWTPPFYDWCFMLEEPELDERFSLIPDDTDILLTHGPAHGHGDRCVSGHLAGSHSLLKHVERVQPKLHVFGHIHEAFGEYRIGETISANVSHLSERYRKVNSVVVWELRGQLDNGKSFQVGRKKGKNEKGDSHGTVTFKSAPFIRATPFEA